MYRLFSWEHSYFSGKVRAYLRFKHRMGDLGPGFEDILATPELIAGLLTPQTGSGAVPQVQAPDGTWVQDSSEIIDFCELAHTQVPVVPDPATSPRQCLAAYLVELLADEWMVVPGFWERWYFSEPGHGLNHLGFNEQQWGAAIAPDADGPSRRAAGAIFFENAFGISTSRTDPKAVYAGLIQLGVVEATEAAWRDSQHNLLGLLDTHFGHHDYVLGGRPSLADFGLLAPLYAHLYRDAVPGYLMRSYFPILCEWVERANGEGALNARMYGQKIYSLGENGELVGRIASSDAGQWLEDDELPETLIAVLQVFFEEMWPVLCDAAQVLTAYIASDAHEVGGELPGKTFTATPGFFEEQTGDGPLTHEFEIRGARGRRMVIPYQLWMLQRLERVLDACLALPEGQGQIQELLRRFPRGHEIMDLGTLMAGCRVRKEGARLFSALV